MVDKCYNCGTTGDLNVCLGCNRIICDNCCRVPEGNKHEAENYCIPCYVKAGFSDLWEIRYADKQYGDGMTTRYDVPVGTTTLEIYALARRELGRKVYITRCHKMKLEEL